MQYTAWVELVFRAVGKVGASPPYSAAGSLPSIAEELGIAGLTEDDFHSHEGVTGALYFAMEDLEAVGVVKFNNVGWGNGLTPLGRDVSAAGLESIWPDISAIRTSDVERRLISRLLAESAVDGGSWVALQFVDVDHIYAELGPTAADAFHTDLQRWTFLGDLDRKGLAKRESAAAGSPNNYRPTYVGAVIVEQTVEQRSARTPEVRRGPGRPAGPYVINDSDVKRTYLSLWKREDRRPSWHAVARELGVDDRTLKDARDTYDITHNTFTAKPE